MSQTACRVCQATNDALLCRRHTDDLAIVLGELPGWLDELITTVIGQAKTTADDSTKATKKFEQPLPYDTQAADLLEQARNGLGSWIRHLCESRGAQIPTLRDPQGMARWLHRHIDAIRYDEACAELVTAVTALRDAIRYRVDNLGKRWAGPCTATVVERELIITGEDPKTIVVQVSDPTGESRRCGADLRTRSGAKKITCPECGATYNPVERAQWIIEQSKEHLDTAAFIANALSDAGRPVKAATIRKWAERGKLFAWREDDLGRPLYRVGDVVELLDAGRRNTHAQTA